jgi:hypothetical protein
MPEREFVVNVDRTEFSDWTDAQGLRVVIPCKDAKRAIMVLMIQRENF